MILVGLSLGFAGVLLLFVAATVNVSTEVRYNGRHTDVGLEIMGAHRAPALVPDAARGRVYASTGRYAGAHR